MSTAHGGMGPGGRLNDPRVSGPGSTGANASINVTYALSQQLDLDKIVEASSAAPTTGRGGFVEASQRPVGILQRALQRMIAAARPIELGVVSAPVQRDPSAYAGAAF